MTADGRIGLLLGLVFIAVIICLLKAPPQFFSTSEEMPALTAVSLEERTNVVIHQPAAEAAVQNSTGGEHAVAASSGAPAGQAAAPVRYTVRKGDCLAAIAEAVYGPELGKKQTTHKAIAKYNALKSPHRLQIGQVLVLPDLDADGNVVSNTVR